MSYQIIEYTFISVIITGLIYSSGNFSWLYKFFASLFFVWLILNLRDSYIYDPIDVAIRTIGRGVARWKIASDQDQNPFIKNLHANYAVAYAFALRDIASDYHIKSNLGVSGKTLQMSAVGAQDEALRTLASICPQGQPRDELLGILAGHTAKLNNNN